MTSDLCERLRRKIAQDQPRPTISELEAILSTPSTDAVTINPDGSVGIGYVNPDGPEAADAIEERDRKIAELVESLDSMAREMIDRLIADSIDPATIKYEGGGQQ